MQNEKCPYCHEDADGYVKMFGMFCLHQDRNEGWQLYTSRGKPRPINYCPICGRELRGAKNAE